MTEQAQQAHPVAVWLNRKRWTQTRLAKELGITRSAVSQFLKGTTTPSLETARKIVALSNEAGAPGGRLSLDEVLGGPSAPKDHQGNAEEPVERRPRKGRLSVMVEEDLLNRLRNATFWTPGATLSGSTQDALTEHARRLEAAPAVLTDPDTGKVIHKAAGEPFPERLSPLPPGRRS